MESIYAKALVLSCTMLFGFVYPGQASDAVEETGSIQNDPPIKLRVDALPLSVEDEQSIVGTKTLLRRKVHLENLLNSNLTLTKVDSTCGCIFQDFEPSVLAPGKSLEFTLEFRRENIARKARNVVRIYCKEAPFDPIKIGISVETRGDVALLTDVVQSKSRDSPADLVLLARKEGTEVHSVSSMRGFLDVKSVRRESEGRWLLTVVKNPTVSGAIDFLRVNYTAEGGEAGSTDLQCVVESKILPRFLPSSIVLSRVSEDPSGEEKLVGKTRMILMDPLEKSLSASSARLLVGNDVLTPRTNYDTVIHQLSSRLIGITLVCKSDLPVLHDAKLEIRVKGTQLSCFCPVFDTRSEK